MKCAPGVHPTRGISDREKWRKIEKERERKKDIKEREREKERERWISYLQTEYQWRVKARGAARAHTAMTRVMLKTALPTTPLTPISS